MKPKSDWQELLGYMRKQTDASIAEGAQKDAAAAQRAIDEASGQHSAVEEEMKRRAAAMQAEMDGKGGV